MAGTSLLIFSLALVFLLEGAIVGKMLPTTAIFPAYLYLFELTLTSAIVLTLIAAAAATLGQYAVFSTVKNKSAPERTQWLQQKVNSNRWYQKARAYFKRVTPSTLLITNIIPGVRGLLMIPLAESKNHSTATVLSAAFVGNVLHFALSAILVFTGWYALISF